MTGINKGSPAAWTTRSLIEAWIGQNPDGLEAALEQANAELPEVVWNLIVVVGGTIDAIAIAAGTPYHDVLSLIWAQLAEKDTDSDVARVMRAAITAWTSGSAETAELLNESGALRGVAPSELIMHLLAVAEMLARRLTEQLGQPFGDALEGYWRSLGTEHP